MGEWKTAERGSSKVDLGTAAQSRHIGDIGIAPASARPVCEGDVRLETRSGVLLIDERGPSWRDDTNADTRPARLAGVAKLVDATDLS